MVGGAGNGHALRGHLTQNADGNSRAVVATSIKALEKKGQGVSVPREWVAHHEVSVDAQLLAKLANLILEQLPQGLDEFQLHFVSKKSPKMIQA